MSIYESKSHSVPQIIEAIITGKPLLLLDTGNAGEDDLLVQRPGETIEDLKKEIRGWALAHEIVTEDPFQGNQTWTLGPAPDSGPEILDDAIREDCFTLDEVVNFHLKTGYSPYYEFLNHFSFTWRGIDYIYIMPHPAFSKQFFITEEDYKKINDQYEARREHDR